MKWISVEDRLPALNVQCLVIAFSEKKIFIAWQYADGWWEYGENYEYYGEDALYCANDVTHWMELPEPPKEL